MELANSFEPPHRRFAAPTEPQVLAQVKLPRGELRMTTAALTLVRPGSSWLLGAPRLRYVAVRRVKFVFWYWLGGLLTCYCLIMIQQDAIKPLPGWGGLLLGAGLLAYGLRGAWMLTAHLLDAPEPFACFLHTPADDGALLRFEHATNEYLRALAEARRLHAEAEEAALREATTPGFGPQTVSLGGARFLPAPPPLPSPYPPALLPGILS